jgi:hypothetical protein
VFEVAHGGKGHRHASLIGCCDCLFITNRSARLDYTAYANASGIIDAISKWEECVLSHA